QQDHIKLPEYFIKSIPHVSFVWGDENVDFLRKRYEALVQCHLFRGMQYSENKAELKEWMPLVLEGRNPDEKLAATRMDLGTDVNFGALTRCMLSQVQETGNVSLHLGHEVRKLRRTSSGYWQVK